VVHTLHGVTFRLADPDGRYAAVRLCSDLPLSDRERTFTRRGEEWVLRLAPPPVVRLEYELELVHRDGGTEVVCEPGNPHRAPGAFGEKSVALLPGYEPPLWLDVPGVPGELTDLAPRGRGLRANVHVRVWSPEADGPLPLLVAHDGPELDELAELTRYAAAMIAAGELPPHRVALVAPGHRDEWYSGSALYARALINDVLPVLPQAPSVVGMGASLGALAALHVHARAPFAGLFLQSGSFFVPRHDAHESRFPRYRRVVRVVRELTRDAGCPVPATLTCGIAEENLANNRLMARALAAQGFDAELHEVPDMHNFTGWRDALHPHLTRLLAKVWA
jgi:enterochelin esterase family protein